MLTFGKRKEERWRTRKYEPPWLAHDGQEADMAPAAEGEEARQRQEEERHAWLRSGGQVAHGVELVPDAAAYVAEGQGAELQAA